jgi:hypothetical protein
MDLSTGSLVDATDEEIQPGEVGEVAPEVEEEPEEEKPETDQVESEEPEELEESEEELEEDDEEDLKEKAAQEEIRQFIRWVRKSPSRSFEFVALSASYAKTLNKFVEARDFDSARWYAERYL